MDAALNSKFIIHFDDFLLGLRLVAWGWDVVILYTPHVIPYAAKEALVQFWVSLFLLCKLFYALVQIIFIISYTSDPGHILEKSWFLKTVDVDTGGEVCFTEHGTFQVADCRMSKGLVIWIWMRFEVFFDIVMDSRESKVVRVVLLLFGSFLLFITVNNGFLLLISFILYHIFQFILPFLFNTEPLSPMKQRCQCLRNPQVLPLLNLLNLHFLNLIHDLLLHLLFQSFYNRVILRYIIITYLVLWM